MTGPVVCIIDVTTKADGMDAADAVREAVAELDYGMLGGPIEVHVHVCRPRLRSAFGSGGHEGILKDSADAYPMDRGAIEQGWAVITACENTAWQEGAVTAVILTCSWGERSTRVQVRLPPATVADLLSLDLAEAPIIGWA